MTDEAQPFAADVAAAPDLTEGQQAAVAAPEPEASPAAPQGPVGAPGQEGTDGEGPLDPTLVATVEPEDEDEDEDEDEEALNEDFDPSEYTPVSYHDLPNPNALRGVPAGPPPHPRTV